MAIFEVRVFETSTYTYLVEADSEDSAVANAVESYENDDTTDLLNVESALDDFVPYVKERVY